MLRWNMSSNKQRKNAIPFIELASLEVICHIMSLHKNWPFSFLKPVLYFQKVSNHVRRNVLCGCYKHSTKNVSCRFGHIYWRNLLKKLHFLCSEKRKHHPLPFKMCRNSKDLGSIYICERQKMSNIAWETLKYRGKHW